MGSISKHSKECTHGSRPPNPNWEAKIEVGSSPTVQEAKIRIDRYSFIYQTHLSLEKVGFWFSFFCEAKSINH